MNFSYTKYHEFKKNQFVKKYVQLDSIHIKTISCLESPGKCNAVMKRHEVVNPKCLNNHRYLRKEMGHMRNFNILDNALFLAWTVDK